MKNIKKKYKKVCKSRKNKYIKENKNDRKSKKNIRRHTGGSQTQYTRDESSKDECEAFITFLQKNTGRENTDEKPQVYIVSLGCAPHEPETLYQTWGDDIHINLDDFDLHLILIDVFSEEQEKRVNLYLQKKGFTVEMYKIFNLYLPTQDSLDNEMNNRLYECFRDFVNQFNVEKPGYVIVKNFIRFRSIDTCGYNRNLGHLYLHEFNYNIAPHELQAHNIYKILYTIVFDSVPSTAYKLLLRWFGYKNESEYNILIDLKDCLFIETNTDKLLIGEDEEHLLINPRLRKQLNRIDDIFVTKPSERDNPRLKFVSEYGPLINKNTVMEVLNEFRPIAFRNPSQISYNIIKNYTNLFEYYIIGEKMELQRKYGEKWKRWTEKELIDWYHKIINIYKKFVDGYPKLENFLYQITISKEDNIYISPSESNILDIEQLSKLAQFWDNTITLPEPDDSQNYIVTIQELLFARYLPEGYFSFSKHFSPPDVEETVTELKVEENKASQAAQRKRQIEELKNF